MEQSTCRHCGDEIDLVDGEWVSDADDVCGTDLRRGHQPDDGGGPCCIAVVTSGGRDHVPGCYA